jgi:hypothetical protein
MLILMIIVLVIVLINLLITIGLVGFMLRMAEVVRETRDQLPISVVPPSNNIDLNH